METQFYVVFFFNIKYLPFFFYMCHTGYSCFFSDHSPLNQLNGRFKGFRSLISALLSFC